MKIGLVELPQLKLIDSEGKDWAEVDDYPLASKQVLMASLEDCGFEVELFDLRHGDEEEELGEIDWRDAALHKIAYGKKISSLEPTACDAWAVTSNFTMYQELALLTIQHLARSQTPVVVGGADGIFEPQCYFEAGATAVVVDKSGGANGAAFDYVLGQKPRSPLTGMLLADGTQYPKSLHPLSPQDWSVPSVQVAQACFSHCSTAARTSSIAPFGSLVPDLGCDRTCSFCTTPTYKLGYLRMTPERVLEWCAIQKQAGAKGIFYFSDQFLGRVLFGESGRQEVFEILQGMRDLGLSWAWENGIELRKATQGHGKEKTSTDLLPDEELVNAMWGWDGHLGCFETYIPAERPLVGRQNYKKLLPWQQHCEMMKAIVRAGVPSIQYGLVVGLPDDSHDSLLQLEEAIDELYQDLKRINPSLFFSIMPNAITPLTGTPQSQQIREMGLLRFEDPCIRGNAWTPSVDTLHLSYKEVADWQRRLMKVGSAWTTLKY